MNVKKDLDKIRQGIWDKKAIKRAKEKRLRKNKIRRKNRRKK